MSEALEFQDNNFLEAVTLLALEVLDDLVATEIDFIDSAQRHQIRKAAREVFDVWGYSNPEHFCSIDQSARQVRIEYKKFSSLCQQFLTQSSWKQFNEWLKARYFVSSDAIGHMLDWSSQLSEQLIYRDRLPPDMRRLPLMLEEDRYNRLVELVRENLSECEKFELLISEERLAAAESLWDVEALRMISHDTFAVEFISAPLESYRFIAWWQSKLTPNFTFVELRTLAKWLDELPLSYDLPTEWDVSLDNPSKIEDFPCIYRQLFPENELRK